MTAAEPAKAEANVRRAIGAMRASVLLRAVVGHPPVAVGHPAAVEEAPVAAAAVDHGAVVAAVVAGGNGEQGNRR